MMNYINDDYLLGHLLKQARLTKLNSLTIDILQNKAEPTELLTSPILLSINSYAKWFPEFVKNGGSSMTFISSAVITIEFDLEKTRQNSTNENIFENPYYCKMTIIDDKGKSYIQQHDGWWFPEL